MNQPCGCSSCAEGAEASRAWVTTCAEPVLPQTVTSASFAR